MPDGVRLAADLCLPERRGEHGRFPGLLEYLPDRTDEGRGGRFSDLVLGATHRSPIEQLGRTILFSSGKVWPAA